MLKQNNSSQFFPLMVKKLIYANNNRQLIDGLNFKIELPGVSAIMGPNGAGKSLTLRLLHGLIKPTSGSIKWGTATNQDLVQEHQAMVFQKPILLRRTVQDNLIYALKTKPKLDKGAQTTLLQQALARAQLTSHAKSPARTLSGGEQQRLAMARALIHRPSILFLDEPTSSLDPSATKAVEDLIKTATLEGTKVIMVTHDIGQARRLSDEIIFLNQGKVTEHGTSEQVMSQPNSLAAQQYFSGQIVTSQT